MVRHTLSLKTKLDIAEFALKTSINAASIKYGPSRSSIRKWIRDKSKIEFEIAEGRSKKKRLPGAGAKIKSIEMETDLVSWIEASRENDHPVSRTEIMRRARESFKEYDDAEGKWLKASTGWLQGFMKRNHLSLRRQTSLSQRDPEYLAEKIASFIIYVSSIRKKYSIEPKHVTAMDETSVFFSMPPKTTVTKTGSKSVLIKSTGHEKSHVTVCLAANGDGTKLKPFIAFKGAKKEVKAIQTEKSLTGVEVYSQHRGWMNTELTHIWLDKVFGESPHKRLLAWDSFSCHRSKQTKSHFLQFKSKMAIVPGGTTKYIQAPDVSWNAPFKAHMIRQYSDWIKDEDNMSQTPAGNLRPPPRPLIVKWVKESWDLIPEDVIVKSFKSCGLTTDWNGDEDDQIHCIKYGEQCRPAWHILQDFRSNNDDNCIQIENERQTTDQLEILLELEESRNAAELDAYLYEEQIGLHEFQELCYQNYTNNNNNTHLKLANLNTTTD